MKRFPEHCDVYEYKLISLRLWMIHLQCNVLSISVLGKGLAAALIPYKQLTAQIFDHWVSYHI